MKSHSARLSGVFLPVSTPFNADMSVDYAALRSNMQFYAQSGVQGYLALGSNGENRHLFEDEKRKVLETILAERAPHQVIMTGCIYDSTPQTVEFMKFVKSVGSDFATLLTPSYFRNEMTHEALLRYFTECADSVDIPVLLYNAPRFTGVTIEPRTVFELAKHPNIAGIKDSSGSTIKEFSQINGPEFSVLAGSASYFYTSMAWGVRGGVVSMANSYPECGIRLYRYGLAGQNGEGLAYHERMERANNKISGRFGVPGVKAAMDIAGLAGGYPRRPLLRLEGSDREAVKAALHEAELP